MINIAIFAFYIKCCRTAPTLLMYAEDDAIKVHRMQKVKRKGLYKCVKLCCLQQRQHAEFDTFLFCQKRGCMHSTLCTDLNLDNRSVFLRTYPYLFRSLYFYAMEKKDAYLTINTDTPPSPSVVASRHVHLPSWIQTSLPIATYCAASIIMTVTNKYVVSGGFNMVFLLLTVQVKFIYCKMGYHLAATLTHTHISLSLSLLISSRSERRDRWISTKFQVSQPDKVSRL